MRLRCKPLGWRERTEGNERLLLEFADNLLKRPFIEKAT